MLAAEKQPEGIPSMRRARQEQVASASGVRIGTEAAAQPDVALFGHDAMPGSSINELGETPHMTAVQKMAVQTTRRLLEERANPNEQDCLGETALMEAASRGHWTS